jgi:hypothetical protein
METGNPITDDCFACRGACCLNRPEGCPPFGVDEIASLSPGDEYRIHMESHPRQLSGPHSRPCVALTDDGRCKLHGAGKPALCVAFVPGCVDCHNLQRQRNRRAV